MSDPCHGIGRLFWRSQRADAAARWWRRSSADRPRKSLTQLPKKEIPNPALAPEPETVAASRVRAVARWDVGPGRARAKPPEDPVQHPPVVRPLLAANVRRKNRLDCRPLRIRQVKPRHS